MRRRGLGVSVFENMAFALVAMRTQKLRSFLTLLGVMAGVATVIMMVSFVVGFNNALTAGFTSFGASWGGSSSVSSARTCTSDGRIFS